MSANKSGVPEARPNESSSHATCRSFYDRPNVSVKNLLPTSMASIADAMSVDP